MPEFRNPYHFLCWFCREMLKTLSKQPSFFCSKRLERFVIFASANISLDICTHNILCKGLITWEAAVAIYAAQMVYAGYTTKQIFNDQPKTITSTETNNSGSESTSSVTAENT